MSKDFCLNCFYYFKHDDLPMAGECTRTPPVIIEKFLNVLPGPPLNQNIYEATKFPTVDEHYWCGEYQPEQENQNAA